MTSVRVEGIPDDVRIAAMIGGGTAFVVAPVLAILFFERRTSIKS